jgi:hypothetical protein
MLRTRSDFLHYFRHCVAPKLPAWRKAKVRKSQQARRFAWHETIADLVADGALPRQAFGWACPERF